MSLDCNVDAICLVRQVGVGTILYVGYVWNFDEFLCMSKLFLLIIFNKTVELSLFRVN